MISRISLKNFQGHKESVIDFDKGINVITGSSSAGKTAIMRGVSWITTNRPPGNAIVSYWNRDKKGLAIGETSVEVISNDNVVKRIKDKATNGYTIDGRELSCIGLDVPEEVGTTLDIDNLNIHRQLDPHFLLSETPGEVARYLNSLIGLSAIDKILYKADFEVRVCNKTIAEYEAKLLEAKELVKKYSWAVEAEKLYKEIEVLENETDKLSNTWAIVSTKIQQIEDSTVPVERRTLLTLANGFITQLSELEVVLKRKQDKIIVLQNLIRALENMSAIISRKPLVAKATDLISTIDTTTASITALQGSISKLQGIINKIDELAVVLDKKAIVDDAFVYIERIDKFNKRLEVTVEESRAIKRLIDSIALSKLDSEQKQKELATVLASLPATCPLCGGELKGDSCG
jgi:DNA repair protein SbcC/Rad50